MADGTKIYLATRDEVNTKTAKHLLSLVGDKIYEGDKQLTFAEVRAMLLNTPDFVVLVYNDKAYHPNTTNTSNVVFSSTTVSSGNIRVDRITMASNGTATTTYGEAEKTSSKTDDIAGNSTSSTKYPSAKAVWDTFLPRTGGTVSGEVRVNNGGIVTDEYASISGAPAYAGGGNALFSAYNSNTDRTNRRVLALYSNDTDISNALKLFTQTNGQFDGGYNLFGEHNLKTINTYVDYHDFGISGNTTLNALLNAMYAKKAEHGNMRLIQNQSALTSGITDLPFGYGILCITRHSAGRWVIIYYQGDNHCYFKVANDGDITSGAITGASLVELGGGGMRVPIAYGQGQVDSNSATLTITGKGTIWLRKLYSTGTTTLIIDGVTITNRETPFGNGSGTDSEGIPFDFEKSVSYKITSSGNVGYTSTYYSYQLYK